MLRYFEGWDQFPSSPSASLVQSIMEMEGWYFPWSGVPGIVSPISTPGRYNYGGRLHLYDTAGALPAFLAVKLAGSHTSDGFTSYGLKIGSASSNVTPFVCCYDAVNARRILTFTFEPMGVVAAYTGGDAGEPFALLGRSDAGQWHPDQEFDIEAHWASISTITGEVEARINTLGAGAAAGSTPALHLIDVNTQPTTSATENDTVPNSPGPYTITVAHAASFLADGGVTSGGSALTKVSGAPAAGQYSVSAGVYTFNSAQALAAVSITYTWGVSYFDSYGFGWLAGSGTATIDFYIDDLRFYDTTGAQNNTWLSTARVQEMIAGGDGATLDFSKSNTGLAAWQNIINKSVDDTLYLFDGTVGDYNLSTPQALVNSPTVFGIGVMGFYRQDDATQRYAKSRIVSGGVTSDGASFATASSYAGDWDVWELDPSTSLSFTGAAVNALQFGPLVYA
jgi:hypothetical protein